MLPRKLSGLVHGAYKTSYECVSSHTIVPCRCEDEAERTGCYDEVAVGNRHHGGFEAGRHRFALLHHGGANLKIHQEQELPISLDRSDAENAPSFGYRWNGKTWMKTIAGKTFEGNTCATKDAQPIYDFEITQKGWMEVEQSHPQSRKKRRKRVP